MNIAKKFLTISSPLFLQVAQKTGAKCKKPPPRVIVRKQFYTLKENQKKFQLKDGKPVWLKGKRDKLLYQLTCLAVYIGLGRSFYEMYALSFKKTLFGGE